MCVSTALLLLNVAAPQVALSAIAVSLDASFADLQWVMSGYALALAVFLLSAGSLADRFQPAAVPGRAGDVQRRLRPCAPSRRPPAR